VQSSLSTDPIWVLDYHTLVLDYRGSGHIAKDDQVLALRPGSVGPVTPRASNPENPLASGADIVAVRGEDLVLDGQPHTLKLDLAPSLKTPQIDTLLFALHAGAQLNIDRLQFLADPGFVPCDASSPISMPSDARSLAVHGPLSCAGATATSLRGREPLTMDAHGQRGSTLYLDLYFHLAGFTNYIASAPSRPESTSDPTFAIVNLRYADAPSTVEQEFPILVSAHRHQLLNDKRSLYAIPLDPRRRVLSVELLDRSPHVQLVLFNAALSDHSEVSLDSAPAPTSNQPIGPDCTASSTLGQSPWFSIAGNSPLKPSLQKTSTPTGLELSLAVTNPTDHDITASIAFPSLAIHVSSDSKDVSYLFPQRVATISSADQTLSADYGPGFLLQFTDVYAAQARCGAAVVVEDLAGQSKTFVLTKAGALINDHTDYVVRVPAHQTYTLPSARVILHNGDWHSGFNAYRQWVGSWYQPRNAHSVWLQDSFYMRRDYPVGGSGVLFDEGRNQYTFPDLIRDGKAFGGIDFIDISGWALSDTHGRVGDYPIELGGVDDLRRNIALAADDHIETGLYFEGYLVDKNSDIGQSHGPQWQIIGEDGKGLWWPHGSPEMFLCPHVRPWQEYLSHRMASSAKSTGAQAVYLDEFGCGKRRCYAPDHGHPVGANMVGGEMGMTRQVRQALDEQGLMSTILYTECPPVDVGTPYVDGTFSYALPASTPDAYGAKLNLWRFAFPRIRLWDMVSSGVEPHILSAEDFRFAFWHGDGVWLKGRSNTWYGDDILEFLRWAHPLLQQHARAFAGEADPLVTSPDPQVLINRFHGGGETVYTLFNSDFQTRHFQFHGKDVTLAPRGVDMIVEGSSHKSL
jgi:hypothetical protein